MTFRIDFYYDLRIGSRNQESTLAGMNQHVVLHGGELEVLCAGNERASSVHPTQANAERAAREIAMHQPRPHGHIRDKNPYGHDQYPPKG